MNSFAAAVAAGSTIAVDGTWQRHVAIRYADQALVGRRAYGRWGTENGCNVLYLGKPTKSVVVEAYRHLIDPVDDPKILAQIKPRVLLTCRVAVSEILDLRSARTRVQVGLTVSDLMSGTFDEESYARCQKVAEVAHQLGRQGLIAPSATGLGETLALFTDRLSAAEMPQRSADDVIWEHLPPDPRSTQAGRGLLRLVPD